MISLLVAGVASIVLSLAALPPLDEATVATDLKAGTVHHPEVAAQRLPEPLEKADRHEATDRPACVAGRTHDAAKPARCTAAPTRRNR